jgi:hypothetical protein
MTGTETTDHDMIFPGNARKQIATLRPCRVPEARKSQ